MREILKSQIIKVLNASNEPIIIGKTMIDLGLHNELRELINLLEDIDHTIMKTAKEQQDQPTI